MSLKSLQYYYKRLIKSKNSIKFCLYYPVWVYKTSGTWYLDTDDEKNTNKMTLSIFVCVSKDHKLTFTLYVWVLVCTYYIVSFYIVKRE